MPDNVTPANATAVAELGGAAAALGIFGKMVAWLVGRRDRQSAENKTWEASLREREDKLRSEIEHEMAELRAVVVRMGALLNSVRGVAVDLVRDLRRHNPQSETLLRAEKTLRDAFPVDFDLPPDMAAAVSQLDGRDAA